ncbi:hypothetical protein [Klebsiella pneumoniae]|uniref:hypothetical protein n=1 Tax=Klebsiella pneumoniae TaxID=573 RepID=UPI003A8EF1E9
MTYSVSPSSLLTEYGNDNICRVLALDGGGAKGFYTLGDLDPPFPDSFCILS